MMPASQPSAQQNRKKKLRREMDGSILPVDSNDWPDGDRSGRYMENAGKTHFELT